MGKKHLKTVKPGVIDRLRERIDRVDLQILSLLNRRAGYVLKVGKAKAATASDFYAPDRERQVIKRLKAANKGPFPNQALKNVFREIMSASLSLEKPLRVAFLGPVATFTHQACMQHFGLSGEYVPKRDIPDVFNDVEKGRADFGVVPVENTTEGAVSHTLDMFIASNLRICAEILLEVSLALMNRSGDIKDIATVRSHPQALAQSRGWVKNHIPGAFVSDTSSTAMAAKMAAEDTSSAAIASAAAATLYDLKIIERNIEDSASNFTRFLVIGKKQSRKTGADKTSIAFAINDAPGALYSMLKPFARRNVNMTKIESRPIKTKAWEYVFFVDVEGHITDRKIKQAVAELEGSCSFLKILGSYPRSS